MDCAFKDLHWSKEFSLRAYHLPSSLEEALDLLETYQGRARVIAGGTDVIPSLRRKTLKAEALVDISNLPGLKDIVEVGEEIHLGSLVTHAQAACSPLIQEKAHLLSEGAGWVGSPQIRNVGTVAGNLVGGQPAGRHQPSPPGLKCLGDHCLQAGGTPGSLDPIFSFPRADRLGPRQGNPDPNPFPGSGQEPGQLLSTPGQTQGLDPAHSVGGHSRQSQSLSKADRGSRHCPGSGGPHPLPGHW